MRVDNNNLTINDVTNEYYKLDKSLSKKQIKQVLYTYNKLISYWMIHKGYEIYFPHRMGNMSVLKYQMGWGNKLHLDFQQWKKDGSKVYFTNNHSDNYYAWGNWKKSGKVVNKRWYTFKFTRGNNREIAKIMKTENGHQIYKIWS